MANKYLDSTGLEHLWGIIKSTFSLTSHTHSNATTSVAGFMSDEDKSKLNGIASGAEVNQNAFQRVTVTQGSTNTNIDADTKTDALTLIAGTNVTLTADATNDKITIDAAGTLTNPDLGQGYATCSTAASTMAKTATLTDYKLTTGGIVFVKFTNNVEIPSGSSDEVTLNINSKGAKAIRYKGVAIANKTIFAGDMVALMYDGTYYQMLLADGRVNLAFQSGWIDGTNTTGTYHQKYIERRNNSNTEATNISYFTLYEATQTQWGAMSTADKTKLDGLTKGSANGVCPLNANAKVDSTYLPSYVDDVIEAYARTGATALSSTWLSETSGGSALTPETGKIYVLMEDSGAYSANSQFRWSGTAYVKLADGGVSEITNAEIDAICV